MGAISEQKEQSFALSNDLRAYQSALTWFVLFSLQGASDGSIVEPKLRFW
jgi:hypothetical protein